MPASASPAATGTAAKAAGSGTSGVGTNGGGAATAALPAGAREVVRYAVPIASYPALLTQAMAAKYRPVSLDGYDVGGATYVNAVFRPSDGTAWYQYIEMSASGYQSRFDSLKSQGYRLASVESYLHSGQIRYAGIWVKSSGPDYYAFHAYSATDYQKMLDTKTAAGYLPENVSAVAPGGVLSYTGLLVKRSLGNWILKSTLSPTDYQTLFNQETKAGLAPAYLDAYTSGGTVRFIALFASVPKVSYQAQHGMTASQAASVTTTREKSGYLTGSAAGYDDGGQARFLVYWSH
ncbi:hypothetical protein Raf01_60320 [Rugosimonospora africana]|uniref:Uncharacterized protein n=1 Tax=Rugosimonospora africana TaxID=556532 RepID=A0A8J3VT59_9ACTN|nr:hypothetical protein Raf01_60320 [Rugosimonospora africana]